MFDIFFELLKVFALSRVERCQNDRLFWGILHGVIDRVDIVLGEAVDWLLVLVPVVTAWVIVSIFLLYHFSFLVIEQLEGLIIVRKPWVLLYLLDREPFVRIDLQKTTKHISGFWRYILLECINTSQNERMQLLHAWGLERHCSIKHCEKHHTCAPQINIETVPIFVLQDLRGYISWSSALFSHFDSWLALFTDTKVTNLDWTLSIEQNVVQFDISMTNMLRMNIVQAIDDLLENLLCEWLLEPSSLSDVVQKVTTCT